MKSERLRFVTASSMLLSDMSILVQRNLRLLIARYSLLIFSRKALS